MVKVEQSEFAYIREQVLDNGMNIFDRYPELHAACDFWMIFHKNEKFRAMFPGDFEAFGRSLGLDWVFDHAKCPEQFRPYLDLIIGLRGCFNLTLVPEGVFTFDSDGEKDDTWGLHLEVWDVELDVWEDQMKVIRKDGKIPGLRERQLIALLEWEIEKDDPR